MRAVVCVDMEGATGIDRPSMCFPSWRADYRAGIAELVGDARAAVEGLLDAGAEVVGLTDWHYMGRNLPATAFEGLPVSRLWSTGVPLIAPTGLEPADVAVLVAMHAGAGHPEGFMSHTYWQGMSVILDGVPVSEAVLWALALQATGTRVVAFSGDARAGEEAARFLPGAAFVATKEGRSRTSAALRPAVEVREELRAAVSAPATEEPGLGAPGFPLTATVRFVSEGLAKAAARRRVGERTGQRDVSTTIERPSDLMPWVALALLATSNALGPRLEHRLYPDEPGRGRIRSALLHGATGWVERAVVDAWMREDPAAYPRVAG